MDSCNLSKSTPLVLTHCTHDHNVGPFLIALLSHVLWTFLPTVWNLKLLLWHLRWRRQCRSWQADSWVLGNMSSAFVMITDIFLASSDMVCQDRVCWSFPEFMKETHGRTFLNSIAARSCFKIAEEGLDIDKVSRFEVCRFHLDIRLLSQLGHLSGDASVVFMWLHTKVICVES